MVRDGIHAVAKGKDPSTIDREEGKVLLTYSNDTVLRIPQRPNREEDNQLLLETGRKVAEDLLRKHPAANGAGVS